jgi:hypothetical protein
VQTIKTVIKLALVALVANATWHLFEVYSPHFKFRDAVQYAAQYRGDATDADLQSKILDAAIQFEVPVTAAEVSVTHQDSHTIVGISYTRVVELAPGFTYPWPFSISVDTFTVKPTKAEDLRPE